MDEILFPDYGRKKRRDRKNGDISGELFDTPEVVPTDRRTAPYQQGSETSRDAAERIAPRGDSDKAICYRAIVHATRNGDYITRKEIAEKFFAGKQNFVTGRVHDLIHLDKIVFEKPVVLCGVIALNAETREPILEKRDGSVLLVAKGIEPLQERAE
jgi:hypothetical protein